MKILGVSVSDILFKAWSKQLVYPAAPFFLNDELRTLFPALYLTRAEFQKTIRDLSFHDSYSTYHVSADAPWVTLLSNAELKCLPSEVRLELLRLQVKLGRGQIYNFNDYKTVLNKNELEQAHFYTFDFEGRHMLELNHTLWNSLSLETQKRWLTQFISDDRSQCLSSTLSKHQWKHINKSYLAIKHLVGFTDKSGANCFATTLSPLFDAEHAKHIASLWLQPETFLRTIAEKGYIKANLEANEHLTQSSILIWENDAGLQHACFYIGNDLVLNKDAQAWFAPRQILKLETVLATWSQNDLTIQIYSLT